MHAKCVVFRSNNSLVIKIILGFVLQLFYKLYNVHVEEFYYLAKDHTRYWPLIPTPKLGRNAMIKILRKCYVDSYILVYHLKSSVYRNGLPSQNFVL